MSEAPQRRPPAPEVLDEAGDQAQFEELIERSGAVLTGHFELASGKHARRYFSAARLLRRPEVAEELARELAEVCRSSAPEMVLGANEAGSVLAAGVARELGLPLVLAGRRGGEYRLLGVEELEPGVRVLVVDDVTTTGGTAEILLGLAARAGAQPAGLGLVATKGMVELDLGVPVIVLGTLRGMDAVPSAECPACADGLPPSPTVA